MFNTLNPEIRCGCGAPTIKCGSAAFEKRLRKLRSLKPFNLKCLIFGQQQMFWKCKKCGEEYDKKPPGGCNNLLFICQHHSPEITHKLIGL